MPHLVDSIDIILVYAIRIRFGIFREIEMSEEEMSTGVKAGAAESAAKDNWTVTEKFFIVLPWCG